jgi:glycosyltransferase involved in cell wall biosynthesis
MEIHFEKIGYVNLKIAFLGPSHPWRGGIAQFAENLAIQLRQRDDEVMMYTFIRQYPDFLFPGGKQTEAADQDKGLPTRRVLTPYNPFTWLKTIRALKAWQPDILFISYWLPVMAPAFGIILCRLPNIKKVWLIHNLDFHEKWLFADILTRFAMQAGDKYVTLSQISAAALKRMVKPWQLQHNIKLFHPVFASPAGFQRKCFESETHTPTILFFGFIKPYKGLDILLKALPLALKKLPKLRLIIAGDVYGDKQQYLDLIKLYHLEQAVEAHFRYLTEPELADFFSRCDLCVLPYRSATQSGVVQMAFAYEVPVLATKVGGISEAVTDGVNGLLVEPENPVALAQAILRFFQEQMGESYSAAIRTNNTKYSWDSFTVRLMEKM